MSSEAEAIILGNLVRLQVIWRNRLEQPEDPGTCLLRITPPGPPPATVLTPTPIKQTNVGEWAYEFEPSPGGLWKFKFLATEGLIAAAKGTFTITND